MALNYYGRGLARRASDPLSVALGYGATELGREVIQTVADPRNFYGTPHKRKSKTEKSSSKKQKMDMGNIVKESGRSNVSVSVIKKKGKVKHFKGATKAQPTKLFKQLVERATKAEHALGHKTDYEYFYMPPINRSSQGVGLAERTSAFSSQAISSTWGYSYKDYWMFHPYYFLDAASVLFNNKAATQSSYNPTTANSLGFGAEPGFEPATAKGLHARFTVVNSFESWIIKNNTQRTITVKILLCQPKAAGVSTSTPYSLESATYAAGGAYDFLGGPVTQWVYQINTDRTANQLTQNLPETLKTLPQGTPAWNSMFKSEMTEVVLEPGTTYDYHVEGPKDLTVDFEKYLQGNNLFDIRTYCRAPVFIWHADIVGNSGSLQGKRFAYLGTQNGTGVFLERKKYCKISCPANLVGPIVTEANLNGTKPQQIAFNRPRYFTYVWEDTDVPSATQIEVQKQNPQATSSIA